MPEARLCYPSESMEYLEVPELTDANATPETAATAVNAGMERLMRRAPGQYLWSCARYKQPAGEG